MSVTTGPALEDADALITMTFIDGSAAVEFTVTKDVDREAMLEAAISILTGELGRIRSHQPSLQTKFN